MRLKRFQEVPHTYQMALVRSELVKGLARRFGGEELATQPEDFEFDPWNPQKGGRRELCRVVLHSPHRYPGAILPETGRNTGEDVKSWSYGRQVVWLQKVPQEGCRVGSVGKALVA